MAITSVNLGAAGSFAVLAGTTITNTGATTVAGIGDNVGLSPAFVVAITGFPPGTIAAPGTKQGADSFGTTSPAAQTDLAAAYNAIVAYAGASTDKSGIDQGGTTLTPGVYDYSGAAINTGILTLNGAGYYVFRITSTYTTSVGSSIVLAGGATANKVFFKVGSSATIGANMNLRGNILALTSISLGANVTVAGRLLARNGAVTLNATAITAPVPPSNPNSITVLYTPQTTGCHIICYGQTSPTVDNPLCCITDNTVSIPGTPKAFEFVVADPPCNGIVTPIGSGGTYAGYVQPCCDLTDTLRVSWGPVVFVVA